MDAQSNENITMSRYAFERMQAKDERNDHWRNIALIWACVIILVLIILLVVTNVLWLRAWNDYDYVDDQTYEDIALDADGSGDANYIGQDGVINNGEYQNNTETQNEITNPQ